MTDRTGERRRFRPGSRALRWGFAGLLVVGGLLFLLDGANRPSDPVLKGGRQRVEGFGQIGFRVDRMASAQRCALLAQNREQ